ncbi:MAG: hypothetical protein QMC40_06200 [Vicingaceae bacterium]|jgi:hypothetical protein|tara:strand:- start:295 stop:843 length:549 start_codon:yes stop_codon:yes gene_type:complete
MKELLIKVLLETHKIVYRDILVNSTHNLLQLHQIIKRSYDFKSEELASFIKEEEGWDNDIEYPLSDVMESGNPIMEEIELGTLLKEEGDQLTYTYDYLNEWKFHLEVIEIETGKLQLKAPKILKRFGESPKEDDRNVTGDDAQSILLKAMMGDEFAEEDDDLFKDPFESDNMESLDDYEEYL